MKILKYSTLIFLCFACLSAYSKTKSASGKAGDNKSDAQLKKTCPKGVKTLKAHDFSSSSAYQNYVSLCAQAKTASSSSNKKTYGPTSKSSTHSSASNSSTAKSSKTSHSGITQFSSGTTTAKRESGTTASVVMMGSRTATLSNSTSTLSDPRVPISNRRVLTTTSNPVLGISARPARAVVASRIGGETNSRVNTGTLAEQRQSTRLPDNSNRTGGNASVMGEGRQVGGASSNCQEQFDGPIEKFKKSCCTVMYNIFENNYLQSLSGPVETPVKNQQIEAAFLTLTVMGAERAESLLHTISNDFAVVVDISIARINHSGKALQGSRASTNTISKVNDNLSLLKYAIKVADTFIDPPTNNDLKARLLSAFGQHQYAQANAHLNSIRRISEANLKKAQEVKEESRTAKKKAENNVGGPISGYNSINNAKTAFDDAVSKLQGLCAPTYSFTVLGNYPQKPPSPPPGVNPVKGKL